MASLYVKIDITPEEQCNKVIATDAEEERKNKFRKNYAQYKVEPLSPCINIYVTEFAKRGLPHTSNFLTFKDHNLMFKYDRNLKLTPRLMPC